MASQKFNVVLFHCGGGESLLSVRDRTAWTKRTANKHGLDMQAKIDAKKEPFFSRYKAVMLAPDDYAGPCVALSTVRPSKESQQ